MLFDRSPILLPVNHIRQRYTGECLAACAVMALTYIGMRFDYARMVQLLHIQRGFGVPFSNIRELEQVKIKVIHRQGTLKELYDLLVAGWPCIVSVQTRELPYWNKISTQHAILVVGMDQEYIYLNDPEFDNAPVKILLGDFDLAWLEQDEFYAVLS